VEPQLPGHGGRVAEDQVHGPRRRTCLGQDFDQQPWRCRRIFGGLQHHRAARGQRGAELAGREHRGEVPGRDRGDHAQRHRDRVTAAAFDHAREALALDAPRLLAVPLQRVDRPVDLAACVGQRLARLGQDRVGRLVETLAQESRGALEHRPAVAGAAPCGESGLRGADRRGDLVGRGERHAADDTSVSGIDVVQRAGASRDPVSVDEKVHVHVISG
jgi:hypothetical protein